MKPDHDSRSSSSLKDSLGQFLRLIRVVKSYWRGMVNVLVLGLIATTVSLILPFVSKLLIDEVYPTRDVGLMSVLVATVLVLRGSTAAINSLRDYYSLHVHARMSAATSLMFFGHLQRLPLSFYHTHRVGEIMSRFSDVRASLSSISRVLTTFVSQGVYLVFVPPILFALQWRLALVVMLVTPIAAIITVASARFLRELHKRTAESFANVSGLQVETLSLMPTVKSLTLERVTFDEAKGAAEQAVADQLRAGGASQVVGFAVSVVGVLGTAAYTWYGWSLILGGEMTLGSYIAFTSYVGYVAGPFRSFANLFSGFQQTAVNLARMFEYLDLAVESDGGGASVRTRSKPDPSPGTLSVDRVSYSYSSSEEVLRDVTVHFPPSSTTAIVGASGAGKSTLLTLLQGLAIPDSGAIMLDGHPLGDIRREELRQRVVLVWQVPQLFRGTLRHNLTIGLDHVNDAEVSQALEICQLSELVAELRSGLETPVGEWGATLSAGQRQRVALARALIRNPDVLLLDEATVSLDEATEDRIAEGLFDYCSSRCTLVFAAHRLELARKADAVCVMRAGTIVGSGPYDELRRNCEALRALESGSDSAGRGLRQPDGGRN